MDDIFVTQPFPARHVRFTKNVGVGPWVRLDSVWIETLDTLEPEGVNRKTSEYIYI